MKINKTHNLTILSALVALAMTGCSSVKVDEAKKEVLKEKTNADRAKKQADTLTRTNTTAEVFDTYFVSETSFELTDKERAPSYFNDTVFFNQQTQVSLREILDLFTKKKNVRFEVTEDALMHIGTGDASSSTEETDAATDVMAILDSGMLSGDSTSGSLPGIGSESGSSEGAEDTSIYGQINRAGGGAVLSSNKLTFEFEGSMSEALDLLTQKYDISWKWDKDRVVLFRTEIKNYIFDGANISTTLNSSISSKSSTDESNSSIDSSVELTTSKMFDEIRETISNMTSDSGSVNINSNTGVITVNDIPSVQSSIKSYIDRMNAIVNKRIFLKTSIIELESDDTGNYGVDLNAVFSGSSNLEFGFNPIAQTPASGINFGVIGDSNWSGSTAVINMLSEYNNTVTSREFSVNTQNGQVIPFQIIDKIKYLEKLTVGSSEEDGETSEKGEMEISEVVPGFSMNLLPRITSKNDVSLQVLMNVNTLSKMKDFVSDDGKSQATFPEEAQQQFSQAVTVGSGQTVMLTGFEQNLNESKVSSLGSESMWAAGGTKSGGKKTKMTIVLITPYIMAK